MRAMRLVAALVVIVVNVPAAPAARQALGYFEQSGDVGQPAIKGSTSYDPGTQTYTIIGSGTNMWANRDEFQFAWRKMTGDFIVRTNAALQGTGTDPHRKIGWIIRKTLDADSPYVDVAVHGDGLTSLQFRKTAGEITEQVQSTVKGADVIQLARKGGTYTMSVERFGDTFTHNEITDIDLGDEVNVGLFVCSHNPTVSERAVFKNVRIVVPPKEGWVPYRDYIGSNLEVMDVATGDRTVLATSPISLQAPNWTRDGKELIYNSEGKLYRFDLATRKTTLLDTGFATRCNNDHGVSPDGTMLAISDQSQGRRQSLIYTLPITGGSGRYQGAGGQVVSRDRSTSTQPQVELTFHLEF